MQEVFEKIIEKLNSKKVYFQRFYECEGKSEHDADLNKSTQLAFDDAIEIVKQEAEKFGTDTNVGGNGWIPCSERLPEPIRPVLVTLRNWMNDKYIVRVGRFHTDHWKTDEGIVENSVVIAWQPLPQPYHPKFIQECANPVSQEEREELNKNIRTIPIGTYQTQADRIRSMSDEELAGSRVDRIDFYTKSDIPEYIGDFDGIANGIEEAIALEIKWLQSKVE